MHNHNTYVNHISLCSGYDGIGLGLKQCIPNIRNIAMVEREIYPCAVMVAKMEEGKMDSCPVFTDVNTFPWEQFRPAMGEGILSFGWPCQPVSSAGKRKATEDERWLFDIIADGIELLRPRWLFAENVEGLLSAKMPDGGSVFGHCIERLESLHYRVEAGIFSAEEVGAPHQRKRVFILANSDKQGRIGDGINAGKCRESKIRANTEKRSEVRGGSKRRSSDELADSDSCRWQGKRGQKQERTSQCSQELANTNPEGLQEHREQALQQEGRGEEGRDPTRIHQAQAWPARPGEPQYDWEEPRIVANAQSVRKQQKRRGSEVGVLPEDATGSLQETGRQKKGRERERDRRSAESGMGCSTHGPSTRVDQLRILGNGVVPQTAALAWTVLMKRLRSSNWHKQKK